MLRQYLHLPRAVHTLCLGTFINRAGTMLVPFLTVYLTTQRHLSVDFATFAMGAWGAGSLVGALTGGHLADHIGRRRVMLISLLGAATVLFCFGTFESPPVIVAGVFGCALLADMYRPAASAMIADLVEPAQRPHAFGLMYVAINLGFSIGPVLGGILTKYSYTWLFRMDGSTSAAYAAIILFAIAETLPRRAAAESGRVEPQPAAPEPVPNALQHILRDRAFLIFCGASLCMGLMFMQSMSTFPIYLHARGIEADRYGRILALNGVMIVCLQLPLTHLLSRFNRASVIVWSAVLTGAGFGLIGAATSVWEFAATVVVWTAGEMMSAAYASTIVSDLAPVALRARYMGAFSMCFSSAMMFGAPLGGLVLHHLGGAWLWGGAGAMGLIAAALYLSIHRAMTPPSGRRPAVA
jgi:MFS family permease